MVSGRRPKYHWKQILDLSFLFTLQNVASGYTIYHLENYIFLSFVCFTIMSRKIVVSRYIGMNIETYTTLNTEGLKRGTKRINMKITWIFHFTWPSEPAFTCSKSAIKTEM